MNSLVAKQSMNDEPLKRLGLKPETSRVVVIGLGKTGLSVVRFLKKNRIHAAVVDSRQQPPGISELITEMPGVAVFLGGFDRTVIESATHLVVSPGVSLNEPEIFRAQGLGIPFLSDIDLFAAMAQAPVVAITGSNGKSTVTTLVGLMAETGGRRVKVGANLGTPALDLLEGDIPDIYVLELSSFQLERTSLLQPIAATVLNISPDHMDRYSGIDAYAKKKQSIFNGSGTMVLNADDTIVSKMYRPNRVCVRFGMSQDMGLDYGIRIYDGHEWLVARGKRLIRTDQLRIKGRHNIANALAALALGNAIGLSKQPGIQVLKEFPGLDHRMQWVAEIDGVIWINDSKATNIGACQAALEGLPKKAVLIAGGDGKGADFSALLPAVVEKVRVAVLMGKDADRLQSVMATHTKTITVDNMQDAVDQAGRVSQKGDTVLLSPACASTDQFTDYQERGRSFTDAVQRLKYGN